MAQDEKMSFEEFAKGKLPIHVAYDEFITEPRFEIPRHNLRKRYSDCLLYE